jgi:PKD repeat protein
MFVMTSLVLSARRDPATVGRTVTLKVVAPFGVTPTAFSATATVATGPVQVATVTNASNGGGTYSAIVNWGDSTPVTAATVAPGSGNTETVTALSHTYSTAGTYTVTITVSNTDGTTIPATEQINVAPAGPSVLFSPSSFAPGAKVQISFAGFPASATVVFHAGSATGPIEGTFHMGATGSLTTNVTVPSSTKAGTYTLYAVDGTVIATTKVTVT